MDPSHTSALEITMWFFLRSWRRSATIMLLIASVTIAVVTRRHPSVSDSLVEVESVRTADAQNLIYSDNPSDSWNEIFRLLFSRTISARISDELSAKGPFITMRDGFMGIRVSTEVTQRFEVGDRPIDPLYPSFFNSAGVRYVLAEPQFSQLKRVLTAAISESEPRPPLARALMQSDVWAAHDILYEQQLTGRDSAPLMQRKAELIMLLAQFTKKLTLRSEEIRELPENYSAARRQYDLPDLFSRNGPWIEIQSSPDRLHDVTAGLRRYARVFVKPVDASMSKEKFLEGLRQENFLAQLDSAALVMQDLLIDEDQTPVPTHLTIELQIRDFLRDAGGKIIKTDVHQYEMSRKSLLTDSQPGGLLEIADKTGVYLSAAGNDYGFATPQFTRTGNDYGALVTLHRRCEGCHGPQLLTVFTLASHNPTPLPFLTLLEPDENTHGWYVAGRKWDREEFQALRRRQ